jgi:hypothetical protein
VDAGAATAIEIEFSHLRGGIDVRSEPGTVPADPSNEAGAPVTITGLVPPGCTLQVRTTSASISTDGVFEVSASSQTGRIVANQADRLHARVVDADVQVGEVFNVDARVQGSGDITVGHAGVLSARTTSGHITIERHAGESRVNSESGNLVVENFESGTFHAGSITGAITIDASHGTTGGGNINALSEAGPVTVTVDSEETAERLRINAGPGGQVSIPAKSAASESEVLGTPGIPSRSFGANRGGGLQL